MKSPSQPGTHDHEVRKQYLRDPQPPALAGWRGSQVLSASAGGILSPGGEKTLKAGESRRARQGPSPDANPSGAIATLSDLMADLSRQLAQALKETTPVAVTP